MKSTQYWHIDDGYNVIISYKKFCSVFQDAIKMFQIRGLCVKCSYSMKMSALELKEKITGENSMKQNVEGWKR